MTGDADLVAALEAERNRPDTKPETTEELLRRLIGVLRAAFRTPADREERA